MQNSDNQILDDIPTAPVKRSSRLSGISAVWLIPLVAAIIALLLMYTNYRARGPLISITFESALGITEGKTKVRHKDVTVGLVEKVSLANDFENVQIDVRIDRELQDYLGDTARFWVVTPEIQGLKVSGLDTLLSGAYIEVDWTSKPENRLSTFTGFSAAPITEGGTPGRQLELVADSAGAISVGSPIYFRSLEVGRVESRELSEDASAVIFKAFVEAPYHELLYGSTRFWNASGITAELGLDGLAIELESLSALVSGGIAFDSVGQGSSNPVRSAERTFVLYDSRIDALENSIEIGGAQGLRYIAEFNSSIRGLKAGSGIDYQGFTVGKVLDVVFEANEGFLDARIYAVLQVQPELLGLDQMSEDQVSKSLGNLVQRGLRVELASSSLITGGKRISLVMDGELGSERIDYEALPYPRLPSTVSDLGQLSDEMQGVVQKISALELEQTLTQLNATLASAQTLLENPKFRDLPDAIERTLASMTAAAESVPPMVEKMDAILVLTERVMAGLSPESELYVETAAAAKELKLAARRVSELAETLEDKPNSIIRGRGE